ncbi:hypothetical protein [Histophilus somni]|uniref:Hemophilus-specific protein, uncharacterized n=1 Tax=Histophilus somni (strain 129Pt) TaxID=205914 RepID=Q0I4G7_HISS1|nr:hypothetical protein [Histophilus somni]
MNKLLISFYRWLGFIVLIVAIFLSTLLVFAYFHPAFAQYGKLSPEAQLAYDEEMARIEWISRKGDIPPPPTQADVDYMQKYTEQLQAQYDKEGK